MLEEIERATAAIVERKRCPGQSAGQNGVNDQSGVDEGAVNTASSDFIIFRNGKCGRSYRDRQCYPYPCPTNPKDPSCGFLYLLY